MGKFEAELTKRTTLIAEQHKDELQALRNAEQQQAHEIQNANRRVEDSLREVAELRERNHELESQMIKVARVGKREEMDFADEVRTWAGIHRLVRAMANHKERAVPCRLSTITECVRGEPRLLPSGI